MIDTALVPDTFDSYNAAWTIYGVDEAVKKVLLCKPIVIKQGACIGAGASIMAVLMLLNQ